MKALMALVASIIFLTYAEINAFADEEDPAVPKKIAPHNLSRSTNILRRPHRVRFRVRAA